jgi:hypothetical protein
MFKLKSKLIIAVIVMLGTTMFMSCNKDHEIMNPDNTQVVLETKQNKDFNDLALIVSKALNESKDFRTMIKKEVLRKFDGDFDIIISDIKDKPIHNSNLKSGYSTVGAYLNNLSEELNIKTKSNLKSSAQNYIDQLTQIYPDLQISVPVHAADWDDNYIPVVTFIPEEYNEKTTKTVVGYNNTKQITVDAQNIPNKPVIVIGENERIGLRPEPDHGKLLADINIQGMQTQSGIRLYWTVSDVHGSIQGYHIFRKGNGTTNFIHIGDSYGSDNLTYDDNKTGSLISYSYYVKAFNYDTSSFSSNIINITSPDKPQAVESFNANLYLANDLELHWEHPAGQYIDHTTLYKRVIEIDNDYKLIGNFQPNTHYYIDHNLTQGKRIVYKINEVNNMGFSNAKYDFAVIPYRDISTYTPVYIKEITFNWSDIKKFEGWLRGAPEFKISVVKANANGTSSVVNDLTYCDFSSRHSYCSFNNKLISNWLPANWMEVYTFKVYEYDGGPKVDININATYKTKNTNKTGFGASGSVNVKIDDILGSRDDYIGTATLEYISPSTTIVQFSNYNFKIKISDKDN